MRQHCLKMNVLSLPYGNIEFSMEKTAVKINSDLEKFIEKYQPSKFKHLTKGIEIRGIKDMHTNLMQAKEIIEKMKLRLTVSHNAEMISYGGFEVNTI